jgi:hypothetical protein
MESRNLRRIARQRVGFKRHFLIYCLVNFFLIVINLLTLPEAPVLWVAGPILGWGIGIFCHWYFCYRNKSQTSVEREMDKLRG